MFKSSRLVYQQYLNTTSHSQPRDNDMSPPSEKLHSYELVSTQPEVHPGIISLDSSYHPSADVEKGLYGTFRSENEGGDVRAESKNWEGVNDGRKILLSFLGSVFVVGFLVLVGIVGVGVFL